ncbi:hypothetical protein [Paenibacillus caui]|uniref:hypothetical protein n=1 Tax=Paenibacillus caui TaxID=2873927 RepID=UPI001CA8B77D|nr:hypothetical protein [Paenibacillus caui]
MNEQADLGYPNFKKGIAASLVTNFNLNYDEALRLAFMPEINEQIMKDVPWAQHMGAEYWAEVIAYNHL